jgi:hypothetical protein
MHFIARIRRGSPIDNLWRRRQQLSGEYLGVRFAFTGNNILGLTGTYESGDLSVDDAVILRDRLDVQLVTFAEVPNVPEQKVLTSEPPPEVIDIPEPESIEPETISVQSSPSPRPVPEHPVSAAELIRRRRQAALKG